MQAMRKCPCELLSSIMDCISFKVTFFLLAMPINFWRKDVTLFIDNVSVWFKVSTSIPWSIIVVEGNTVLDCFIRRLTMRLSWRKRGLNNIQTVFCQKIMKSSRIWLLLDTSNLYWLIHCRACDRSSMIWHELLQSTGRQMSKYRNLKPNSL